MELSDLKANLLAGKNILLPLVFIGSNNEYLISTYLNQIAKNNSLELREISSINEMIDIESGMFKEADYLYIYQYKNTDNINFKSRISKKQAELLRFTQRQAQAILDLRLSKLVGLEIEALIKEHETTLKNIEQYKDILTNPKTMDKTIIKELDEIKSEIEKLKRDINT